MGVPPEKVNSADIFKNHQKKEHAEKFRSRMELEAVVEDSATIDLAAKTVLIATERYNLLEKKFHVQSRIIDVLTEHIDDFMSAIRKIYPDEMNDPMTAESIMSALEKIQAGDFGQNTSPSEKKSSVQLLVGHVTDTGP